MSTRFFTNYGEQTLFKKFQGVFQSNPDIEWFDALVGFLRASGYFAIRPYLEKVPNIRILVGINVDAIMADYHRRGLLFLADPTKALEEFKNELRKDIQNADYTRESETGILQFVDDVISKKIELKAHPTRRLHAKLYIFRPKGFNEHKPGAVITGSSNLTAAGMGVDEQVSNYEFNVVLHDYDDVKFSTDEFDRLWKESVDILPKFLKEVRDSTYLASTVTPHELYHKLLLEYFGQSIEYDPNAITDLPEGYKRLSYQVDAVTSGFRLLEKHGGFFLADVVGLGKTMIATLIAKKFFFYNGFPEHRSHTLIVVPPAVEDSWRETAKDQFRLDNCDIITNGSLHKVKHAEKYDLVIVDEAHKFRNDTAEAFDELQRICKSPTRRFLPDGSRASKRVILVSATPLNNRPDDIRNLISLFQDLKDSTLSVANLQHFFARCQKEYQEAHKLPDAEEARQRVKTIYERIRTKIISEVTVRRTRNDLMEHDDYKKDLEQQAVVFPKIEPPRKILYQLPPALEDLYDRTMLLLSRPDDKGLTYNRYRAIGFLKADKKKKYQNADRISAQLATIMRTLLVKRLDSSFHAFKESLRRFRDATNVMREMFARGTIYIAPNLNVTQFLVEGREEELIAKIAERQPTDPTIEICSPSDFVGGFVAGLEADGQKLDELYKEWKAVEEDPKLDEFLLRLKDELFDSKINRQHKLVVFSESEETTTYLLGQLAKAGYKRVLTVSSKNRAERMPVVRANFDANLPAEQKRADDYDMLISTEVLAEGVNLHRANVVVNANSKVEDFDRTFRPFLAQITDKANEFLNYFPNHRLRIEKLDYTGSSYAKETKELTGKAIIPEIEFNGQKVEKHHEFLNEARLTALALSVFLAAVALADANPADPDPLRLLVLDDVLIGLDLNNRFPLLELLRTEFPHHQILLLTHDLVWFDIAREHTAEWGNSAWNHARLFEEPTGPDEPFLPRFERIKPNMDDLKIAEGYIRVGDLRAAAVYIRAAYEATIKAICKACSLPVAYQPNPRDIDANTLWTIILRKHVALRKSKGGEFLNPALIPLISAVRSQVLNRLSHSGSSSLTSTELQTALKTIAQLRSDLNSNPRRIPFKP